MAASRRPSRLSLFQRQTSKQPSPLFHSLSRTHAHTHTHTFSLTSRAHEDQKWLQPSKSICLLSLMRIKSRFCGLRSLSSLPLTKVRACLAAFASTSCLTSSFSSPLVLLKPSILRALFLSLHCTHTQSVPHTLSLTHTHTHTHLHARPPASCTQCVIIRKWVVRVFHKILAPIFRPT